ncbi:MAG: hypothetical protein V1900_00670 [Candidatus Aenigmatarchaeota archaeon]
MEYAAKVAIVFILLFVGIAYVIYTQAPTAFVLKTCENASCVSGIFNVCNAITCDDCNKLDSFVGEKFCSGENVYQFYRDYQRRDGSCVFSESNKIVEDCNAKDKWVDVKSYPCCDGNNRCICRDQEFIDYSCEYGRCFEKTTQTRTLKDNCKSCARCSNGECIGCSTDSDCGKSDWIDETQCSGNDVYQKYRTYKCVNPGTIASYCTYTDINKFKQSCSSSSYDLWGSNYCKNNDVYHSRNYFDRGCSNGKCYSSWTSQEELVEDCLYSCSSGSCLYNYYPYQYPCTGSNCGCQGTSCTGGCGSGCGSCSGSQCQTCSSSDCDRSDGYVGSRYCSGNNVYQKYRDYYCSGNSCTYSESEKSIEYCSNGCSNGYCNSQCTTCQSCSGTDNSCGVYPNCNNCNNNDGYTGSRFCSGNNVYQKYRDYYCSGNGCTYSETDKLVETCSSTCSNGQCQTCQTCSGTDTSCGVSPNCVDCNAKDGFIDSKYCFNNNVYQTYRDYSCSGTTCIERDEKRLIETCSYGCSNGYCNTCTPPCNNYRCSDWGQCGTYPNCYSCGGCQGYNCGGYSCSSWGQCGTYPNCYNCGGGCYGSNCYDYNYPYYGGDYYCDNCYDDGYQYTGGDYYNDNYYQYYGGYQYDGNDYYCDNCYDSGYDGGYGDYYSDDYY